MNYLLYSVKMNSFLPVSVYALISWNALIMDNEGSSKCWKQIQVWVLVHIYNLEAEWGKELSQLKEILRKTFF